VITSTDGKTAELSTTNNNVITAGYIRPMPEKTIEFKAQAVRPECQSALDDNANWVTIGTQKWLKVNTKCIDYDTESEAYTAGITTISTSIRGGYTPYYTDPTTTTIPDYLKDQSDKLGMWYNWAAAVGVADGEKQIEAFSDNRQGICPNGSHIPSVTEWNALRDELDASVAGKKMKTSTGWQSGTGEGNDGFAALPAGYAYGSRVSSVGRGAYYWSSDAKDSDNAHYRSLFYYDDYLNEDTNFKYYAYSVRCLRN
ncbi:MAG: hypothetical protein MJ010_07175, partial [Paludibacteraceae bacterium]|nr:hypothetical protein [Paludibacteraceae bacterium]